MREHIGDYGWCRANQHIWRNPTPRDGIRVEKGVAIVNYKCENCTSQRLDHVSLKTGELLFRKYAMSPGYVLQLQNGERPRKDDWRKVHFNHLIRR